MSRLQTSSRLASAKTFFSSLARPSRNLRRPASSGSMIGIMAIPGVGPVVAAGWLAATAAGAAAGAVAGGAAGGLIGAMTESGVSEEHAHVYAEGVRRGGTLVTARVEDGLYADAEAILRQSNWVDPDVRRAAYIEQGWTRFDDTLDPYGPAEIEQERLRYRR